MEKNYLDILAKNILNEVKNKLKRELIILEGEKEQTTDKKMFEIIKSLFASENYKIIDIRETEINRHVINSLVQYYMAIYNDNIELLHKMLDSNCVFLIGLDKRLSCNFEADKYLDILNGNQKLFENFYSLLFKLKNDTQIDSEELIIKFSAILIENKDIAKSNTGYFGYLPDLLNITVLTNFSKEEILKLSDEQKQIAEALSYQRSEETKDFIIDLIKKYNYSKFLIYWDEFREHFSLDEILNLTEEEISMYQDIFCFTKNKKDLPILISRAKAKGKTKIKTRNKRIRGEINH